MINSYMNELKQNPNKAQQRMLPTTDSWRYGITKDLHSPAHSESFLSIILKDIDSRNTT